jgi:hypothetical protein
MKIISTIGFPVLTLIFIVLLYRELKSSIAKTNWTPERRQKISLRILIGFILWAVIICAASASGFTSRFDLFPANAMPVVVLPLITILFLLFSRTMKDMLHHISLRLLTQLQVFRVFVEIILWMLFLQNLLPVQMTFEGLNWDVLTGVTAFVAARFLLKSKPWLIVWNVIGLVLLINIVAVALLSMPTPFRFFDNEPANVIVTQFPFLFLPAYLVPLAYTLHIMSLRKLLMKS